MAGLTGGIVTTALPPRLRRPATGTRQQAAYTYFATGTEATATDALDNLATNGIRRFRESCPRPRRSARV